MSFDLILYNRDDMVTYSYKTIYVPNVGDWIRVKGKEYVVVKRIFRAGSNTIEINVELID